MSSAIPKNSNAQSSNPSASIIILDPHVIGGCSLERCQNTHVLVPQVAVNQPVNKQTLSTRVRPSKGPHQSQRVVQGCMEAAHTLLYNPAETLLSDCRVTVRQAASMHRHVLQLQASILIVCVCWDTLLNINLSHRALQYSFYLMFGLYGKHL